jgi:CheY-like chemotaxis protein
VIASTIAAMRFGYGLPVPEGAPVDAESMLTTLAGPDRMRDRFPVPGTSKALALSDDVKTTSKSTRGMEKAARSVELQRVVDAVLVASLDSFRAAVARALDNPDGLRERLVQFWSDHFSVSRKGVLHRAVLPSAMVEDAIRPNLTAPFAQMLIAVTTNPAMLIYLDQDTSIGPLSTEGLRRKRGLNENLAREVLELHTVGVGAQYDQADVRQLAELMGGSLTMTSRAGSGSQFTATFRLELVTEVPAASVPRVSTPRSSGLDILVAEDNAINRKLIALMLEALGHKCTFAENGEQAVSAAVAGSFDVIFMDVQMPVLDGLGATKQSRALTTPVSKTPIVAVTANAMSGDKEKYMAAGMNNYLSKPLSLQSLMKLFDELKITPKTQGQRAAG